MRNFSPRKLICLMIPIFGTVSIVGTGFSLWVFNNDQTSPMESNVKLNNIKISVGSNVGTFDSRSLVTKGSLAQAKKYYLFPEMLVFEEGHGLETNLTTGLNFYKKITNDDLSIGPYFEQPQPYLDDNVKISFYRDMSISDEYLTTNGYKLVLELRVGITTYLNNFVTVLDSFGAVKEPLYDIDTTKNNQVIGSGYKFDYTDNATKYKNGALLSGADLISEISNELPGNPTEPFDLEPDKNYVRYDYVMNFSKIFRYVDLSKKPTTVEAYKNLQSINKRPNEFLSFQFFAGYIPIN